MSFTIADFLGGIEEAKQKEEESFQEEKVTEALIKQSLKKKSPFDYTNAINNKAIIEDVSDYNPFMVNRIYSMFADTILNATTMNRLSPYLTNQMQYDYYNSTIRPGQRRWWMKNKGEYTSEHIDILCEIYKVNNERGVELLNFLSEVDPESLDKIIKQHYNRIGGRS